MKNRTRVICLLLTILMIGSVVWGCGDRSSESGNNASLLDEEMARKDFTYPIEQDVTLTYFTSAAPAGYHNYADMDWYGVEQEKTGVKIQYIHPSAGNETSQFNLLMASGELPDIVKFNWLKFSGGPQKAINDEVIYSLNDIIDKYAPNFKKQLEADADLARHLKTDEGEYYTFPMIRTDESLIVFVGLMLRGDWLDDLDMEVPETIDDWEVMLKAFKDVKGADAPFTDFSGGNIDYGAFSGAFGVTNGFYLEDGTVKYGPIEPGYKEYIETMIRWYKEGLIDPDIATVTRTIARTKMLKGNSGAMMGYLGGDMGTMLSGAKAVGDDKFTLVGVAPPVKNKGDVAKFGHREFKVSDPQGVAISTNCENVGVAARFIDWAYSEEGMMFYNFGTEGVSYEMIDGYPKYILEEDQVLPEKHIRINGPGLNDPRYYEQYLSTPQQKQSLSAWMKTNQAKYAMPAVTPLTDEASEYATIINEANTYATEMFLRFLFGNDSIDGFDAYVEQLKALGIERAIEIQQNGVERWKQR